MILLDFFRFLLNKPNGTSEKVNNKIVSFLVLFFFTLIVISLVRIGIKIAIIIPEVKPLQYEFESFKFILLAILIGPIIEESVFRLSLTYSKLNLSVSIGLIIHVVVTKSLNIKTLTSVDGVVLLFLIPAIIYLILNHKKIYISSWLKSVWSKNHRTIYFLSAIFFAIIHIGNYNVTNFNRVLAAIVFCLPFIFIGFILGYIRIRFGFFWSILFHSLHNTIIGLAIFLLSLGN